MTMKERQELGSKTDTVVTFDPETYEEKVRVVRNEMNVDRLRHLRFSQNWYWDEKKSRLSIVLNGTSTLMDSYDEFGNFRFSRVMFYRSAAK